MVWRAPAEIEQGKRSRWRVIVIWGILALLVVAALGVQAAVRAAWKVPLGEPVQAGAITARVPAGWGVSVDSAAPRILAQSDETGESLLLEISLREVGPPISAAEYVARAYGMDPSETPRRIDLAGREGALVVFHARMEVPRLGLERPLAITVAAAALAPGLMLHVELQRFGEWNPGDAVLVQQVAQALRLGQPHDEQ